MGTRTLFPCDERGLALPMAMVVMLILSALAVGLSALSATEPVIAVNHLLGVQTRSLAEAGVERAVWALKNAGHVLGISGPGRIPAPYDGSRLLLVPIGPYATGGFRVTVAAWDTIPYPAECPAPSSMSRADRCIVSVGWVPDDTTSGRKAHRKIAVVLSNPRLFFTDPPAALSVRGGLELGDNTLIDARRDSTCGSKVGTLTTALTSTSALNAQVWGAADSNNTSNEVTDAADGPLPSSAHDIVTNLAATSFDQFTWSDADIDSLRRYAKAHGTYRQGIQRFGSGNLPNGVVFVDTLSGANIIPEGSLPATPVSDFAVVNIAGDAPADASGIFRGVLFVNGTLSISGSFRMRGLLYAQNDLSYHATGAGGITGAVISRNIRDRSSTSIDSDRLGTASVVYDCVDARTGGNTLPDAWEATSGTYRELCDTCT
ncbi:MAG TPA: hypothetical protein VMS64_36815 [Candidatus Methylomirabilis sp.]|nr:hypothetical protein [Candidatus Methylomirabilis sp.]